MIKQHLTYAFNKDGRLVHIKDVQNGLACECICPCCKEKLVAKNGGTKRIPHFSHASGIECEGAYETMLHVLAKEKIQKAFLEKDEFNIKYQISSYCSDFKSCKFAEMCEVTHKKMVEFNLRQYYDSCEQEVMYDTIKRRSDLKIYSKANPKYPPIYIEFYVTHPSDKEKLHSGGKIIETKIESEEDIDKIAYDGLEESVESGFSYKEFEPKTSFFGFIDKEYKDKRRSQIQFVRYILFKSGKNRCFQDLAYCDDIKKSMPTALCEICFHSISTFGLADNAKYWAYNQYKIKNCIFCSNYVESYDGLGMICRMYKHLNISRFEKFDTARAKECNCFNVNKEEMEKCIEEFENYNKTFL